jgi:hypothetical protein
MRRVFVPAVAALLLALPAGALTFDTITVHGGLTLMVNGVENGAPSPLVPPVGAWIPVTLPIEAPQLSWEAGVMIMGLTYRFEGDRGVPMEIEGGDTFWTLGILGDLRALYLWPVGDTVLLGPTAGLALLLRFPVIPYDQAAGDWGNLAGFFLTRCLFPEVGVALRWRILERIAIAAQLRVMYPLSNIWDAGKPSVTDQMLSGLLVGLQYKL